MPLTDFDIVTRSLRARLFSTITTAATVAVAVALILVLLSMRHAGERAFRRGGGNAHLLVSRDASPLVAVLNGVFYANPPRNFLEWSKYQEIRRSIPVLEWAIPTQLGDSFEGFPVMATTAEFFTKFQPVPGEPWTFVQGDTFDEPLEVVLGAEVARETGLEVGDEIHLAHGRADREHADALHVHDEFHHEVVGVLAPSGGPHDRALFTPLESAWLLHAHDRRARETDGEVETTLDDLEPEDRKITGIYLRVAGRPGRDISAALQPVFYRLRTDPTITVASPSRQVTQLFQIVGRIDQILLAMAAVVLVSSGIAILLALYNSMEQRRRQIAVLRVLGCSRGRIFGLILTESALLGLFGAAAGILLSWVGGMLVSVALERSVGLVVEPTVAWPMVLIVSAATVALACAAGLVPAALAYRTPVARNLRPVA